MDFRLEHLLNRFAATHDGFADPLALYVGASEFLFLALLVVMVLAGGRTWMREAAVAGGAAAVVGLIAGQVVSRVVDRPRPFVTHPHAIHSLIAHSPDPGFPSDHAIGAFAIAAAICLRSRRWGAVALVAATVMAAGRVALGVHYPADVLGGAAIGIGAALLLWIPPIRDRLRGGIHLVERWLREAAGALRPSRLRALR